MDVARPAPPSTTPEPPRTVPFVTVDTAALHYRYAAPAAGRPLLVFSNSLGTDERLWDAVVADLGADHGILVYDQRGHGLSDAGASPASMADLADDLAALMDHLGVTGAVPVGLSIGGMIVQQLATRRPDLVRALVLCDTAHRIGDPDFWAARIAAVRDGGIASIADAILERWFAPGFRRTHEPAWRACRNMLCRQSPDGYVDLCRAIGEADLERSTARLRVPVLCVVGDADGATPPALVKSLAELIPGARYAVIDGAGHLPCIERPEALSDHVRRFVESVSSAPPHPDGDDADV